MKDDPLLIQDDEREIEDLVSFCPMATLITEGAEGPQLGMFNPIFREGRFYLHLNRKDEQFLALKDRPRARLVFFDFLCHIPSYWVHERYGGAATSYYRYAEFDGSVRLYEETADVARLLHGFLAHYQPEGKHAPLEPDAKIYKESYGMLGIVEIVPERRRTKWKIGQNRPVETRMKIVKQLRARNSGQDARAAFEVEKWIARRS